MKSLRLINIRSHFAAGVLTPALIKFRKGDVQPPLETPFNGSTLKSARSITILMLLAFLTLGAAAPVQKPKEAKIVLSTQLDRTAIWVGDTFHYTVKAMHDPAIEIVVDNFKKDNVNLAPFVVRDIAVRQGSFGANKNVTEIDFLLTTYESGQTELKIPSFPLYYFARTAAARTSTESAAESVAVPMTKIGLRSTLTADTLRPRDNRDIWQVTRQRWLIPLALGLAGLIWLALQLGRRLWSSTHKEKPVIRRLSRRARQRKMRDFLRQAQTIGTDSPAEQQRYYAEVSQFLRGYLSDSLEIDAASLTAQEIETALRKHGQNGLSAPVKNILERCEQVLYSPQGLELAQRWRGEVQGELGKFADLARH